MLKQVIEKIEFELSEIEKLFEIYDSLIEHCKHGHFDLIEGTAMATVLHSFYNGIEKIFLIIAKKIDKNIPKSFKWHKELVTQMIEENNYRKNVITQELADDLNEYLGFRHYYRHSYVFTLDLTRINNLTTNVMDIWQNFKNEVSIFLNAIKQD